MKSAIVTVFPTNFSKCLLRCFLDNGNTCCTLLYDNYDSITVYMAFERELFQESLFECQVLEPKDASQRFLVLTDILILSGQRWIANQSYTTRLTMLQHIVQSRFDHNDFNNEYRLKTPTFFTIKHTQDVIDLFHLIIPNYYGHVIGLQICEDNYKSGLKFETDNNIRDRDLVLTKTRFSDVYQATYDGITPVKGNTIAYIPNINVSLKLQDLFKSKNSMKLQCRFHANRQKWAPIID